MKTIYKSILFVAVVIVATLCNWSCDNKDNSTGTPYISYVRVTNPTSADSLLVAAGQGQLVAIVGGNLQTIKELWVNDLQAKLTPSFISNSSILVHMPDSLPSVVTDKMKLIFADGFTLLYDFHITINKPAIGIMDCEFVPEGEMATIHGSYFYLPVSVTFPGGVTVKGTADETDNLTVSTDNKIITVKVPKGAGSGQLIVTTNFGAQISDFWFRDNRNILEGFDPSDGHDTGTDGTIVTNPGAGDPPLISGPYTRIIKNMGDWDWTRVALRYGGPSYEIPDEAILHPDQYFFKFEVCTTKPFSANGVRGYVTDPAVGSDTPDIFYEWKPPFDSQGIWQTVSIPFEDFASALGSYFAPVLPDGYYFGFVYCEGGALDCDMSYDNFRIVPKTIPKPAGSDY